MGTHNDATVLLGHPERHRIGSLVVFRSSGKNRLLVEILKEHEHDWKRCLETHGFRPLEFSMVSNTGGAAQQHCFWVARRHHAGSLIGYNHTDLLIENLRHHKLLLDRRNTPRRAAR